MSKIYLKNVDGKKCWHNLLHVDVISFLLQGSKKLMNIVNAEEENPHIFWTTWGVLMNFSENMWLMTILIVAKNRD